MRGMIPVVSDEGGYFTESMRICRHEKNRRQQERINFLMRSARVPATYAQDTFADYSVTPDNESAVTMARWIVDNDGERGMFIYGPRGTGKTKLASIVANESAKRGRPVLFSSVPDLMADIRATFHNGNTEETVQSVKEAALLVLDDLGAERPTEWVGEQLFAIVNYRYNEKLTTIITSNYSKDRIIDRLAAVDRRGNIIDDTQGQRIMSRVYGMCARVHLGGADWRVKKAV